MSDTARIPTANPKSKVARGRERSLRDSLQAEKPTLDQLISGGDIEPDTVITMGNYFDLCEAMAALVGEGQKQGLSITDIPQ